MVIQITGRPGVGKSWIMKRLIEHYNCEGIEKIGLINYQKGDDVIVTGKYDGTTFEGSDRLSMAAISSVPELLLLYPYMNIVFEGDRFTNTTMLKHNPTIINIKGDGAWGREKRGSSQSDRRLRAMATRYDSFSYHYRVINSDEALELIIKLIDSPRPAPELKDGNGQETLF